MYEKNIPDFNNINDFIKSHESKKLIRFLTCGSVDDGKSTLIGRLLYDSQLLNEDQVVIPGDQPENFDFAGLLDGLQSEKEQGITIDVAYKYFSTEKAKFILADTPGHEEYTRNMFTGASNCDLALLLIDARKGVSTQTIRHALLLDLLDISEIILVVNKMDLIDHKEEVYLNILKDFNEKLKDCSFSSVKSIPVSALDGDNVFHSSLKMNWYKGDTLIEQLEGFNSNTESQKLPFMFSVQYVQHLNQDERVYLGNIQKDSSRKNTSDLIVLPSGEKVSLKNNKGLEDYQASAIEINEQRDISRGNLIVSREALNLVNVEDRFVADIVWMDRRELTPGVTYQIKIHNKLIPCRIEKINYRYSSSDFKKEDTKNLSLNDIANVEISLNEKVSFTDFKTSKELGSFILVDRRNFSTSAAGMIKSKMGSRNIHWHDHQTTKEMRTALKGHHPATIWFTGLSASGKSTIANALEAELNFMGVHTYLLDGDNIRFGLCRDLGFKAEDRKENIRRVGEVCKLFCESGLIVLSSFISPYKEDREYIKMNIGNSKFFEIFVDAPLEVCIERDPKGLYKKVLDGEIENFTGVDAPYQAPSNPDITIKTEHESVERAVRKIIQRLRSEGLIY